MATAPATPIKPRREMQEVKAPEQFQFTKQGQIAEGILIAIEPKDITDKTTHETKRAMEYLFQAEGGGRFTFLGTWDLDRKINPDHIGHFLQIRYERDDDSFTKGGQNKAKIFKITASKDREHGY